MLLYPVGYLLFLTLLFVAAPFSRKIRRGLSGRLGLYGRMAAFAKNNQSPLWFHVASSGELEQVLPILDAVKQQSPYPILLTYFSPTAAKAIALEKKRREALGVAVCWDGADFSPFDLPWITARMVSLLKPKAFVAIHREIWPSLLGSLEARKVPCFLFATFFPEETRIAFWLRSNLRKFHTIGTTNESTRQKLIEAAGLAESRVQDIGDPRVERVLSRRQKAGTASWKARFAGREVFLCASVWDEDWKALELSLSVAVENSWLVVIVPHEPSPARVEHYQSSLKAARWSEWVKSEAAASHLVVDGVGFLAELYAIASVVFVGGSFKSRVHNVLEPAAYGCPILTGPYIQNSAEALEMAQEKSALARCENPEQLKAALLSLITNPSLRAERSQLLQKFLADRGGAAAHYLKLLEVSVSFQA